MPSTNTNNDEDDVFEVREGTGDKGRDYEQFSVVHYILTLLSDDKVKNFKISSNAKNYGDFDDVVLEIQKLDEEWVKYAMQLKHIENRNISKENLSSNGRMSVKKYYDTWKKNLKEKSCQLVLFTNAKSVLCENDKVDFEDTDFIVKMRVKNTDVVTFLDTSEDQEKNYCFQLNPETTEEHKKFFESFVIYTNQIKSDRMKTNAARKFQEIFVCENDTSFENFCSVIGNWYSQRGRKKKIDKNWAKQIIAICLLLPQYIQPISSSTQNKKCELFEEAVTNFDVTVIPERSKVMTIWKNCTLTGSEFNKTIKQYNLGFLNSANHDQEVERSTQKCLILWLLKKSPLVVSDNPQVLKAIEMSPLKNFVLIKKDFSNIKLQNSFCNLSDLKNQNLDIYAKLIEQLEISLQGKNITLKSLLENHEKLSTIITTKEIVSMLDKVFVVGKEKETLPEPYIPRKLSRNFIDIKYLKHVEREDQKIAIVLSCEGKLDKIEKHIENLNPTKIEENLKNFRNINSSSVLYFEKQCSQKNFDEICKKCKSFKQLHHFRVSDCGNLEWIKSTGTIEDLEGFRLKKTPDIQESDLYESFENSVNIVCAKPGMGKSIIAKSLKNNLSQKFWTIIINPSDVSTFFREGSSNFEDYIWKKVEKNLDEFDIAIMESFKEKKLLAYIWDGLDEIFDHNFVQVLNIVEELSKKGFLQWITARIHLQERLERKFIVFARTVREFDDEQQDTYIRKRLDSAKNIKETIEIVKKIKENIRLIKCDEILGIPLQVYMLTELFVQDVEKYTQLLENIFSISDLYKHFVNEKFDRFFKEKAKVAIKEANDSLKQVLESYKTSYIKKYEKAALRALFEDDFFEKWNINCKRFLENIKLECDGFGFITEVSENMVPTFVHNSYSEYFVASYFHKNYDKIEDLQEILFRERYSNVRFLFDLLMAQDCPAHIAVLYKNIDVLKNNEDKIGKKDKGGRNPLQLACTWGEKHPLLNTQITEEGIIIDNSLGESSIEETHNQKEIVRYLLKKCDYKEKDDLFKMDSLSYADAAQCLFPIFEISKQVRISFDKFINYKDICTVIFYAIKFDKDHIINLIDDIPDFRTEKRRLSLMHLCAEYNSKKCVKKLLSIESYKHLVNAKDKYEILPTRTACKKGHKTILKMFLKNGADISNILELFTVACKNDQNKIIEVLIKHGRKKEFEKKHNDICPLMSLACRRNFYRVVRFLIENGVSPDINIRNTVPIFVASQYNHIKTVKVLIEKGANVDTQVKIGARPLHIACQRNNLEIVRLLADKADINSLDNKGNTPLNVACKNKNQELVEFLLRLEGVDIHKMNKDKLESIHTACKNNSPRIVEMLIDAGAETNSLCGKNRTPLHYACEEGHLEVVRVLCSHDAKKDVVDDKGERPLDLAQKGNFEEIVNFLMSS